MGKGRAFKVGKYIGKHDYINEPIPSVLIKDLDTAPGIRDTKINEMNTDSVIFRFYSLCPQVIVLTRSSHFSSVSLI